MSANGYRLLGSLVWKGGRWYLRRRMPSGRSIAVKGVAAAGVITAAVLLARRLGG